MEKTFGTRACGENCVHFDVHFVVHFVGQMINSVIFAQAIVWKNLGLSSLLANYEAAVATTFGRGRGVFILVRVWSVLSAVIECVEVGAGVVLLVDGLFFGLSSPYCRGARAIHTTRLLHWRYSQSFAWLFAVKLRSKASTVVHVTLLSIDKENGDY